MPCQDGVEELERGGGVERVEERGERGWEFELVDAGGLFARLCLGYSDLYLGFR
jgi:hypothetical protein